MTHTQPRRDAQRRARRRAAIICGIVAAVIAGGPLPSLSAQSRTPPRSGTAQPRPITTAAQLALDEWLLLRFRGAQLLPDSADSTAFSDAVSNAPRVEAYLSQGRRDTLVALQFSAAPSRPALSVGASTTLADRSGVASSIQARVSARRLFRSPRRSKPDPQRTEDWRIGWAYAAVVRNSATAAVPTGFDGWLLVVPPVRPRR